MDNLELREIWKTQDDKLNQVLAINQKMALHLTQQKVNRQISKLNRPKILALFLGLPYAFVITAIASLAFLAEAYIVALGFGAISIILWLMLGAYFYQLHLIRQIKTSEGILSTQEQLSKLRISSIRSLHLAVFQLPFWSVCWMSVEALKEDPLFYGGIHALVFILLAYLSYWLYQQLSIQNSKVRQFFFSGSEWKPLQKAERILAEIEGF